MHVHLPSSSIDVTNANESVESGVDLQSQIDSLIHSAPTPTAPQPADSSLLPSPPLNDVMMSGGVLPPPRGRRSASKSASSSSVGEVLANSKKLLRTLTSKIVNRVKEIHNHNASSEAVSRATTPRDDHRGVRVGPLSHYSLISHSLVSSWLGFLCHSHSLTLTHSCACA